MAPFERIAPVSPLADSESVLARARRISADHHGAAGDLAHFFQIGFWGKILVGTIWLAIAVGLFLLGSWTYDTEPPVQFLSASVVPSDSTPGSRVMTYYKVKVVRGWTECTLDVERSWLDAHGNEWPSPTAHLKYAPGAVDIGLTMSVPMDAWAGVSTVENTLVSSCNPLQKIFPRREPMPILQVNVQR